MWLRLTWTLMLGCCAAAAPVPQVPVKQHYTIEQNSRSALSADHELQPELEAMRLMKVGVNDGYDADAVFYSDGTLQVDVHEGRIPMHPPIRRVARRERRPSAKLTAAELARLNNDMPALDGCRLQTDESYAGHGPTAHFEILTQPHREIVTVASELGNSTSACLSYVKFVVDMVKATVDHEYGVR